MMTPGWQNNEEKEAGREREEEATEKLFQEATEGPGQPHPRHGQPQPAARREATSPWTPRPPPLPPASTNSHHPPNGGQNHQDAFLPRICAEAHWGSLRKPQGPHL